MILKSHFNIQGLGKQSEFSLRVSPLAKHEEVR